MAHKTRINGTEYEITGGKCLVGGTEYAVQKGRTLVGGTGYDVSFETFSISYSGNHNIYGDETKGWIEMLSSGVLSAKIPVPCDLYLLGAGADGRVGTQVRGGLGGMGGQYKEYYEIVINGSYDVVIGESSWNNTLLGEYSSSSNNYANGGSPADYPYDAIDGEDGRIPFIGKTTLNQGIARYPLGPGGGAGAGYNVPGSNPGYGASGKNTGAGGHGAPAGGNIGTPGFSGIAILRWGY